MKYRNFIFLLLEISLAILLTACATHSTPDINPLIDVKTSFSVGNYELASEQSLPLANEGNSEAEYSLGGVLGRCRKKSHLKFIINNTVDKTLVQRQAASQGTSAPNQF